MSHIPELLASIIHRITNRPSDRRQVTLPTSTALYCGLPLPGIHQKLSP
ncbi:hypothetical protein [Enterobacter cloacae]